MSTKENPHIGWIGLGSMGLAMSINIQKHLTQKQLPALKYWNRTISRGDTLKEIGSIPASSIENLVQSSDIIFISLSDDTALTTLITTITSSPTPPTNKIFVDTTTIHPSTTSQITSLLHPQGATYLSAPVFGSTPVAQAGQLLIALAGPPPAKARVTPFLQGILARAVIDVGPTPSKALLLKTTSNFITAGLMYLLSEAHVLAEKTGLPAETLHELVEGNFGAYAGGVSERLMSGAYCPGEGEAPRSGLELGMKDVGHGVSLGREVGVRLEVGELYVDAASEAKAWGEERRRRLDSSSVYGVVRRRGGLEFESEVVRQRGGGEK